MSTGSGNPEHSLRSYIMIDSGPVERCNCATVGRIGDSNVRNETCRLCRSVVVGIKKGQNETNFGVWNGEVTLKEVRWLVI